MKTILQRASEHIDPIRGTCDSLFIVCASYEERTTAGMNRLSSDYRTENAVICRSAEYKDKGGAQQYFRKIRNHLQSCSESEPIELVFGVEEPIHFARELDRQLSYMKGALPPRAVTIDITTFPRQELLMLLKLLDNYPDRGDIRLLYAEPQKYASEKRNEPKGWLTRGVRSVHAVPGFCGIQFPQLAKLLVIILGHEGERTHITLRRHQPDKVIFVGQGDEQYHEGLKNIAEVENQNMIGEFGAKCFWPSRLPARGVLETKQEIERIFQQYGDTHNIFIAPNGTKLQLIGTYLATRNLVELQLTYASPALYNWKNYSTGTGPLWEMRLEPRNSPERRS